MHFPRVAAAVVTVAIGLASVSCKRPTQAGLVDAGSSGEAGASAAPGELGGLTWDGPFSVARTSRGVVVAVGTTPAWLGVVDLAADDGREVKRTPLVRLTEPLSTAPTVHVVGDGALFVTYSERATSETRALLVSPDRKLVGAAAIGSESCATGDAFYFVDPRARRLRRWERSLPAPRDAIGPVVDPRASLLCGTSHAFVVEPAGSSFHVMVAERFVKTPLLDGVDPAAGGASAFYTSGDMIGVVAVTAESTLAWSTMGPDGRPASRRLNRKIAGEQTIVAADGDATSVSVLLQRSGRRRCKEEDAPPSHDLFEVGREAGRTRERATLVPPAPCDSEATTPDLERSEGGSVVRWLETTETETTKALRIWRMPGSLLDGGEARSSKVAVSGEVVLLDCAPDCSAVARHAGKFTLVASSPARAP